MWHRHSRPCVYNDLGTSVAWASGDMPAYAKTFAVELASCHARIQGILDRDAAVMERIDDLRTGAMDPHVFINAITDIQSLVDDIIEGGSGSGGDVMHWVGHLESVLEGVLLVRLKEATGLWLEALEESCKVVCQSLMFLCCGLCVAGVVV